MKDVFKNKIILVTGGCGSIGSEIVRQLLKFEPKQIRVFDNRETESFNMQHELREHENLSFLMGDVRDKERLNLAMDKVDIVFHAAALKHVPSCEYNPFEAVKTNVYGTQNAIECALENEVEKFINISTDKVTNTINTMGATKLLAERLVNAAEFYKGYRKTIFSSVRFGNVVGSNGSVINLFKEQIKSRGLITLTNPEMTRFIMSIPQAVKLVLETAKEMNGGETFILKMPVFKLEDLANICIDVFSGNKKIAVKNIGLRPGEKMYENLMTEEEAKNAFETETSFIVLSEIIPSNYKSEENKQKRLKKTALRNYCSKEIEPLSKEKLKMLLIKEKII